MLCTEVCLFCLYVLARSRLRKLIVNNFKDLDFKVAFQTPRTVGHLFPFKDRVQLTEEKSLVIYKIKCTECEAT